MKQTKHAPHSEKTNNHQGSIKEQKKSEIQLI